MASKTLEQVVKEIVQDFLKTKNVFDSHEVIDTIFDRKEYFLVYLDNWTKTNSDSTERISNYHSLISKMIDKTGLVQKFSAEIAPVAISKVVSKTIFNELNPNKL